MFKAEVLQSYAVFIDIKKVTHGENDVDKHNARYSNFWESTSSPNSDSVAKYSLCNLFPREEERPWADRLPLITNELSYNIRPYCEHVIKGSMETYIDQDLPLGPASICLQEALHGQLLDILNDLTGLASSSEGSGLPSGPLWALWLSPTSDRPSKG